MATSTYELNRERVVAADLFARHGYHGIAELAKAVGLGRGPLYHYIESKDASHAEAALFAGLAPEELLREMAAGRCATSPTTDPSGRCSSATTRRSPAIAATT